MKINATAVKNAAKATRRIASRAAAKKKIILPPEVVEERRKICETCSFNVNGQCQDCFCIIKLKTLFIDEPCGQGKWPDNALNNPNLQNHD